MGDPTLAMAAARRRTRAALEEDPDLTPAQRRTVLDVYAAMVADTGSGA